MTGSNKVLLMVYIRTSQRILYISVLDEYLSFISNRNHIKESMNEFGKFRSKIKGKTKRLVITPK